jgi:hypothetical protein
MEQEALLVVAAVVALMPQVAQRMVAAVQVAIAPALAAHLVKPTLAVVAVVQGTIKAMLAHLLAAAQVAVGL